MKGPGAPTHGGKMCVLRREPRCQEHRRSPPARPTRRPLQAHLILQPVPPPPHVHVPGIGVIEAALAQLAVESDHSALLVAHLRHKARLSAAHGPHASGLGSSRAPPSPRAIQAGCWFPACPAVYTFKGVALHQRALPGPAPLCHHRPVLPSPAPPSRGCHQTGRKPAWCGYFAGDKTEGAELGEQKHEHEHGRNAHMHGPGGTREAGTVGS